MVTNLVTHVCSKTVGFLCNLTLKKKIALGIGLIGGVYLVIHEYPHLKKEYLKSQTKAKQNRQNKPQEQSENKLENKPQD